MVRETGRLIASRGLSRTLNRWETFALPFSHKGWRDQHYLAAIETVSEHPCKQ